MALIVSFCIIVVLIGVLASLEQMKYGLEIAFVFIFLFSALRYGFGNDYFSYQYIFSAFSNYSEINDIINLYDGIWDKYNASEIGWALLNWMFRPLGFQWLIVFTALITNIVYYRFIKKYVPVKWYWLALFTLVFTPSLFFVPLSMMRQSLAMVLFVWAFQFIYEKKLIKSVVIIFIASLFHKSAIVLFPFAFLGLLTEINTKIVAILYTVLFVILFVLRDFVAEVADSALSVYALEGYGEYVEGGDANNVGLGFIFRLIVVFIPLLLFLFKNKTTDQVVRLITFIAGVSFLIVPFTRVVGFFGRVEYYFSIYNIVALPVVYSCIKDEVFRYGLLILYMVLTLYVYGGFFANPVWQSFTHYQTIFSI